MYIFPYSQCLAGMLLFCGATWLLPCRSAVVVLNNIHALRNGGWDGKATLSREMEFLCGAIRLVIVLKDTWGCRVLVGSSGSRVMFAPETRLSLRSDGRSNCICVAHLSRSRDSHCDVIINVCTMCISTHNGRSYLSASSVCKITSRV